MDRIKDKVAIVTACTRGIGRAIADRFAEEGAIVYMAVRRMDAGQEIADAHNALGRRVKAVYFDGDILETIEPMVNQVYEAEGRIDILVNNAGVSDSAPFTSYTDEIFNKVMDLNIKGMFHCSKAVTDQMISQGHGVILNTSSMVSRYGQPSGIAYPTSKFAVNGFTLSLARELGPKGIRVNAVAPGITETDMMKAVPKEMIDPLIAQIPLRRLGQPEDIANAFVFLASEEASYITGVVLSVDGLART